VPSAVTRDFTPTYRSGNRTRLEQCKAMEQKKEPDPQRPPEEWEAVSRQSKALQEIDKLIKSDKPVGEKLKEIVADHNAACDEIGEKLAGSKATPPPEN